MASQDRSTANHIIYDLINHSEQYSFFQAVQLLNDYNHLVSETGGKEVLKKTLIQFSVNPQLSYNKSDIEFVSIQETDEKRIATMSINFLGLYGAVSPLPAFYSEGIIQSKNGEDSTKDFMDLFNHRMISLVYKCWEKYRYYKQYKSKQYKNRQYNEFEDDGSDPFTNWMFALCGLVQPDQRMASEVDWDRLLPFIGMLGMRCHSASVIESILRFYFKLDSFYICSNMKRFVKVSEDQQNRLGLQCATLNHDMVLGKEVEDRSGKFRIKITKLSYERFVKFLPDGEDHMSLKKIVDYVLRDQLEYDIELQLIKQDVPSLSLSHHNQEKLGWSTWVGAHKKVKKSVVIQGRA